MKILRSQIAGRVLACGLLVSLLGAGIFLASAPAQDKGKKGKQPQANDKGEPPPVSSRVVGTVIFPPRSDLQRISSADELFAIAVAKPGEKTTTSAQEMSAKALDYIRKSQQADGSWGDKEWPQNVGVTALCCLAFLAEGSLPRQGPSGIQLARGLEFLLDSCKDDGQIVARDTYIHGPAGDHSWATLCLLQSYGNMPWRRDMRDKLSRAIQVLVKYQRVDGGWRYKMTRDGQGDTLVTANVLITLRLATRAGFSVPADVIDRGAAFLKARAIQKDGRFTGEWEFIPNGLPSSLSIAGCGALGLYAAAKEPSDLKDPRIAATLHLLDYSYKRYSVADLLESSYSYHGEFYCSFFCSQVLYNAGNVYWHPYFRKMLEVFAAAQKADGQFEDQAGNSVYPTATAAIVLQAPRGYLPLYLR